MKDILEIKLLGTSLSIKAENNKEYITKVVSFYQKKLQETQERTPIQDPLKLSILTSFNIVDELFKAEGNRGQNRSSCSTMDEELGDAAQNMIDMISHILEEED
jgi:cell division protein ZapA (FtsZ GTPase activity inhibitor)